MDIEKIKYFRTMIEVENLREAAKLLNITPGALSKSLRSLAYQLDITLFVQQGRKLIPTSKGLLLYESSGKLVNEYESILKNLETSSNHHQLINRVATFEVFSTLFMADYINHHPDSIEVYEYTPGDIEDAILKDKVDIGISYMPILHKDLIFEKTGKIRFGVFGRNHFNNYDFEEIPFSIPSPKPGHGLSQSLSLDGWSFRPRKISFRFEMLQTALEAAAQGHCVLYCPIFLIELFNKTRKSKFQLSEIKIDFLSTKKCSQDVYLIRKKSQTKDSFYKKIERKVKSLN